MNTAFRTMLLARVKAALASAEAIGNLTHAGFKGQLREIVVRELLRPLLPAKAGIGHGQIINAFDQQSTEQDIVVFDRDLVPSLLLDSINGIFPIEASIFCIEVKSRLDNAQLKTVHDSAKHLATIAHVRAFGVPEHVIPCVLAFKSDLVAPGYSELQRYQAIYGAESPSIRSICVVGRGYYFYRDNQWHTKAATNENDEVLFFLADLVARYNDVLYTRAAPGIRAYFADE
jgi:hypothetical protein